MIPSLEFVPESKDRPVLSIVIVDSDGRSDTLRCLESIYRHPSSESFEVLLVDNCSEQSCLAEVQQRFPGVRTLQSPQRQGFARNYNLGLRHALGQYLMILNNDTLVQSGALDSLLGALRDHPGYAFVGPRLRGQDGRIQSFCARPLLKPLGYIVRLLLLDLGSPIGLLWERLQASLLEHRPTGPVACLSGACMLARREALEQIGLLDEGFDFYFEDAEWCHRAQKQGWKLGFVAEAEVVHLGDHSLSKVKVWAKQSEYRSAIRYFQRYYGIGRAEITLIRIATLISYSIRWVVYKFQEVITGKAGHSAAYVELIRWISRENIINLDEASHHVDKLWSGGSHK